MFAVPADYEGHAAGLATSLLWTLTALLFTAAGRRIGATAVNTGRILIAFILLAVTHRFVEGVWWPEALPQQVVYLAVSGVLGLALGDQALFVAFVSIGPRLALLIMTTAPLFAALFGWVVLGEQLRISACLGIMLTVGGVAWVVLEQPRKSETVQPGHRARGIILAFVASACQAAGLLLSKQGIGHGWLAEEQHLSAQAATLMRMAFAAVAIIPLAAVYRHWERSGQGSRGAARCGRELPLALLLTVGASIGGSYLGVWTSVAAADRAPLAVAQTLCALPPVFILPFAGLVYKEHISIRAVLGAAIAVGGVALLFVR